MAALRKHLYPIGVDDADSFLFRLKAVATPVSTLDRLATAASASYRIETKPEK